MAALRDVAPGPVEVTPDERGGVPARGKAVLVFVLAVLVLALSPPRARGTEEYAARTGKACGACHVDPSGGGELTAEGEAFLQGRAPEGEPSSSKDGFRHAVRFLAGFLHLFTAVLWFGTILYVHLLLKPSYAAHGLPRGELAVGWGSIVLIALTGVVLTAFRLRSMADLFHTRFGILLTIKVALYLVMVGTAVIVTFVVGPRLKRRKVTVDPGKRDMTPDELAGFDGKEGRPAYFAYGGKIFDATESRLWRGGVHLGRHQAGFDLTDLLKQAPHGEEKIRTMPAVGDLLVPEGRRTPGHLKAFYFMTYFNLGLVLSILFIVSLWKWW